MLDILSNDSAYLLGALLLFHAAGTLLGIGGSRPWNHQVIWTGVTFGGTVAWASMYREVMPWGYRNITIIAAAPKAYDSSYGIFVWCMIIFHCYYALSSTLVAFRHSPAWPGAWWTLTHVVFLPVVTSAMISHHALNLVPVSLDVFVALWLRYQIWLAKDSCLGLLYAVALDDQQDSDSPASSSWWTPLTVLLHVAQLHSFMQLAQWFNVCVPLMGLRWNLSLPYVG
jgi:hypothetical protein